MKAKITLKFILILVLFILLQSVSAQDCPMPFGIQAQGGTTICGTGTKVVQVLNSQTDVKYQLQTSAGSNIGSSKWGNAGTLSLGNHGPGTYKVVGTKNGNGCSIEALNQVTIISVPDVNPSVSITPSFVNICSGENVSFSANITHGGSSPSYSWKLNGVSKSSASSYNISTLSDGDVVSLTIISNDPGCANGKSATASTGEINVESYVSPSVSISASQNNICPGEAVVFTASPTNGGTSPTYQWKKNGAVIDTGSSYSASDLQDNDVITCTLTSNYSGCITSNTATSNSITVDVKTPPNMIHMMGGGNVCAGDTKELKIGSSEPGVSYQLKTFAGSNLVGPFWGNNGELSFGNYGPGEYKVVGTRAGCPTESSKVTITEIPDVNPSVSITPAFVDICDSENVTFTASITNGGTNPTYNWKLNGVSQATTSDFSISTLSDGDQVSLTITSNDPGCANGKSATASTGEVNVETNVTPTIVISSNVNNICPGDEVTFTAATTYQGTAPTYQWKKNGTNVGINASTHVSSDYSNGDVVTCVLTSNHDGCHTSLTATSDPVAVLVKDVPDPFGVMGGGPVCFGETKQLSVDSSEPSVWYQLEELDGTLVGPSQEGDGGTIYFGPVGEGSYRVSAEKNNNGCSVYSFSEATITENSPLGVSFVGFPEFCPHDPPPTFQASPAGADSYQWFLNDVPISGETARTFQPSQAGTYKVSVTIGTCTETSALQSMIDAPVYTPSLVIQPSTGYSEQICYGATAQFEVDTSTYSGTNPIYQWKLNDVAVGSNSPSIFIDDLRDNDVITCEMTSNSTECITTSNVTSNDIVMDLVGTTVPTIQIQVSSGYANAVCEGTSVQFEVENTFEGGDSPIFQWKRNGQNVGANSTIYSASDFSDGDIVSCQMISNSSSCLQTDLATSNEFSVKVSTYPSVSAGGDISVFEYTGIVTLEGSPDGGTWSGNGIVNEYQFDPAVGHGIYQLSYHYIHPATGCDGTDQKNVVVLANPEISPSGIISFSNPGVTLSIDPTLGPFQWYLNGNPIDGANQASFLAEDLGTYTVKVKAGGLFPYVTPPVYVVDGSDPWKNTIETTVPRVQVSDSINLSGLSEVSISKTRAYHDGLGRIEQNIAWRHSPNSMDIVQLAHYDEYGRENIQILPYESPANDLSYRENAFSVTDPIGTEQYEFYQNATGVAIDPAPFAETSFDGTPLSRVLEQGAPGINWQLGSNTVKTAIKFNSDSAVMRLNWNGLLGQGEEFYPENELSTNQVIDEDGNVTMEFTNKTGQVILKRSRVDSTKWAETYYIYDDFGLLRIVLPPQAVALLPSDFLALTPYSAGRQPFLDTWAFQYSYDERKRMVEKKVPGAEKVLMIYDEWDRLVLTQDGNQRDPNIGLGVEWQFTKYDKLNRPVITGILDGSSGEIALRDSVASISERGESFDASGTHQYTSRIFPTEASGLVQRYLTVTYYDTYDFVPGSDLVGAAFSLAPEFNSTDEFHLAPVHKSDVKGQVTGTLTAQLGSSDFLTTVTFYDEKYRVIQVLSENHLAGGSDTVSTQYDFKGNVRQIKNVHWNGNEETNILVKYEYDHANRLVDAFHTLNGGERIHLLSNKYNALGELVEKNLHGDGAGFAQTVDYSYNIRGWLNAINESSLSGSSQVPDPTDLFSMELIYNTTVTGIPAN